MAEDAADILGQLGLDISPFLDSLKQAEGAMATSVGNMQKMAAGLTLGGGATGQGQLPDYSPAAASLNQYAQAATTATSAQAGLNQQTSTGGQLGQVLMAAMQAGATAQREFGAAGNTAAAGAQASATAQAGATSAAQAYIASLREETDALNALMAVMRSEAAVGGLQASISTDAGPQIAATRAQLEALQQLTQTRRVDAAEAVAAAEVEQTALATLVQNYTSAQAGMSAEARQRSQAEITAQQAATNLAIQNAQVEVAAFQSAKAQEAQLSQQAKQQAAEAAQAQAQQYAAVGTIARQLTGDLQQLGVPLGGVTRSFDQGAQTAKALTGETSNLAAATKLLEQPELAVATAAVVVVGAVLQMTQAFVAYADQIRNTALITGASQLEVQALTAALSAQGIASGQVVTALTLMDQRGQQLFDQMESGQAVTGRMASALHELGISAVAFATANTDQRVTLIADALERAGGTTQATAAAVELLGGRFGRTLIPAIEGGSPSIERWKDATLAANAATEGAQGPVLQWHAALTQLNIVWQGIEQTVGSVALPLLTGGVEVFRLLLEVVSALLSPLRLVGAAIEGVGAGLGKLKDAWDSVPGPIRATVEEGLKLGNVFTAIPEIANRATQAVTSLAEGHGLAGDAAEKHGQKERESAQQITQALALARGAYSNLAPDQSLILLDDTVAKLGKTQAGTTLLTQIMAAEMAHAGRAATDEATLTSQMGAAALAAGIPISEVSRIMQLLNGIAQENGTDFLQVAVAHDEAAQAALRNAQADRELATALSGIQQQATTFSTDLATLGTTGGTAFKDAFGAAAQGISQDLNAQAQAAVQAYTVAAAQLVQATTHVGDLQKQGVTGVALVEAQSAQQSAQLQVNLAQTTATQKIAFAQGYVRDVAQAETQLTQTRQEQFQIQQQIDKLGVGSYAAAARQRLGEEQSLISQVNALEQQRVTTQSPILRALLSAELDYLSNRLNAVKEEASEEQQRAQQMAAIAEAQSGTLAVQASQVTALTTAVDKERQVNVEAVVAEKQLADARQFGAQSQAQQATTIADLQAKIESSTGANQAYYQAQLNMDLAFQQLTPAVAEAVIEHQHLADVFGFAKDKVVDLNREIPLLVQGLHDGTVNAREFRDALLDLSTKPTQEELNLKARLADITAQLAGVNAELANSSPMEQHIAELQKKIRTDQATGVSLEQLQRDQAELQLQLGHASAAAGEQGVALGNLQFELGNTQKATQAQLTAEQDKRTSLGASMQATNALKDGTAISYGQLVRIVQEGASGQITALQGVADKAGPAGKAAGDANTQQMNESMITGIAHLTDALSVLPMKLAQVLTDPAKFQQAAADNIGDPTKGFIGGVYAGDPAVEAAGAHMGDTFGGALIRQLRTAMGTAVQTVLDAVTRIAGLTSAMSMPGYRANASGFLYPASGEITQPFGLNGEKGIDIGVPENTPLVAGGSGRVTAIDNPAPGTEGAGLWVHIDLGGGFEEVIGHLNESLVHVGDIVSQGQTIGLSGGAVSVPNAWSSGPHTEVQVLQNGQLVDPQSVLGQMIGGMPSGTAAGGSLLAAALAAIQAHESTLPLPGGANGPQPMFGFIPGAEGNVGSQQYTSGGLNADGTPAGTTWQSLFPDVATGVKAAVDLIQKIPAAMQALQAGDYNALVQAIAPIWANGPIEAAAFARDLIATGPGGPSQGAIAAALSGGGGAAFGGQAGLSALLAQAFGGVPTGPAFGGQAGLAALIAQAFPPDITAGTTGTAGAAGPEGELPYNAESPAGQSMQTRDLGQANAAVTTAQNQLDQLQQRLDDISGTGIPAAYQKQEDAAGQAAQDAIDAQNRVLAAAIQVQTDIVNHVDDATLKQDMDALNSAKTQASADDQKANAVVGNWNKIVSAVTASQDAIRQDGERANAALSKLASQSAEVAAGQAAHATTQGTAYQTSAATATTAWQRVAVDMGMLQQAMDQGDSVMVLNGLRRRLASDTQAADSADKAANAAFQAWDKEYKAEAQARKDLDAAIRQDVKDETDLIAGLATSYTKFFTAAAETGRVMGPGWAAGSAQIVQSAHDSAVGAERAYHDAAQNVIADERALTGNLTEQDRIRLTDQLNTDKDIAASALYTAQQQKAAFAAVADAFAQMNTNIQQAAKDRLSMDATGFNDFTNKQLASIGLVADKQTTLEQARLSDARSTYDAVIADSQQASQRLIADTAAYNAAVAAGNAVEAGRLQAAVSADQSRIASDQQAAQAIVQQYGTIQQAAETDARAEMQAAKDAVSERIKSLESTRDAALQSITDQERALDAASQKAIQDYTDQATAQKQQMQDASRAAIQAFDDEAAARKQALADTTQSQKDAVDAQTQAQIDAIQAQLDQEQQAKDAQHLADLQAAVSGATTDDARKSAQQQLTDFELQLHDRALQQQIKDLQQAAVARKKDLDDQAKQQQQAMDDQTTAQKQSMTDQEKTAEQAFSDQVTAHKQAMTDQTKAQKQALEDQATAVKNHYNDPQNGLIAVQQRAITEIDRAMGQHYVKQEGDAAASARRMLATTTQSQQDQVTAILAAAPQFLAAGQTVYGSFVQGVGTALVAGGNTLLGSAGGRALGGSGAVPLTTGGGGGSAVAVESPWFGTIGTTLSNMYGWMTGQGIKVQIANPDLGPPPAAAQSVGPATIHNHNAITVNVPATATSPAAIAEAVQRGVVAANAQSAREAVRYGISVPR